VSDFVLFCFFTCFSFFFFGNEWEGEKRERRRRGKLISMIEIASRRKERRDRKRVPAKVFKAKLRLMAQVKQSFPNSGRQPFTPESKLDGIKLEIF
jgi:hypothetical protein